MNNKIQSTTGSLFIALLIATAACNPVKQVNRKASKQEVKNLYPQVSFDSSLAKAALAYGDITIEGVAFTKPKNMYGFKAPLSKRIYAVNTTILLFPVTAYFEAWYKLREEKEDKLTKVYMSEEAFKYRIAEKTDGYGRFKFEKMKPGRYFIQCIVSWSEGRSRDVYRGSSYGSFGASADHYSREYYAVSKADRLEEFITIQPGQKKLELTLK